MIPSRRCFRYRSRGRCPWSYDQDCFDVPFAIIVFNPCGFWIDGNVNALQVDTPTLEFLFKRLTVGAFVCGVVVLEKERNAKQQSEAKQSLLSPCALLCPDSERSRRHRSGLALFWKKAKATYKSSEMVSGRRQNTHASCLSYF